MVTIVRCSFSWESHRTECLSGGGANGADDSASRQLGRLAVSVAENKYTGMRIRHIYRRDRILQGSDQVS